MEIHITHAAFRNKVGQVCKRLELLGEVVHTHALYRQKTTTRKPNTIIIIAKSIAVSRPNNPTMTLHEPSLHAPTCSLVSPVTSGTLASMRMDSLPRRKYSNS